MRVVIVLTRLPPKLTRVFDLLWLNVWSSYSERSMFNRWDWEKETEKTWRLYEQKLMVSHRAERRPIGTCGCRNVYMCQLNTETWRHRRRGLRDTDTEFIFHWEWTRMRLVIMFNSTLSVSVWQRYYLYTYACCTYCRYSAPLCDTSTGFEMAPKGSP